MIGVGRISRSKVSQLASQIQGLKEEIVLWRLYSVILILVVDVQLSVVQALIHCLLVVIEFHRAPAIDVSSSIVDLVLLYDLTKVVNDWKPLNRGETLVELLSSFLDRGTSVPILLCRKSRLKQ